MSRRVPTSDRLRVAWRRMVGLCVAAVVVFCVCQLQSPLSQADEPFPEDPFGVPATRRPVDPAEAARRAAEQEQWAAADRARDMAVWLQHGISRAKKLAADPNDASCLEGTLSLLHLGADGDWLHGDPLELLEGLARRHWQPQPGESVAQMVARLHKEFPGHAQPDALKYCRARTAYAVLAGDDWPLRWSSNRTFWDGLVEALVLSQKEGDLYDVWRGDVASIKDEALRVRLAKIAADRANTWRAKIAADPEHADWYRLGYLAVVREAAAAEPQLGQELDYELVRPWIEVEGSITDMHLRRMADVYRTSLVAKVPADHPARAASLEHLLRGLDKRRGMFGVMDHLLGPALAEIYQSDRRAGRLLARSLVDRQHLIVFTQFAEKAGMPQQERYQWLLGKRASVIFRDKPLGEALQSLQDNAGLPLWIDASAQDDETGVTLETSGPWVDVLESTLRGTKYRLELLAPDVLWVGPPEARRGAAEVLEKSLARVPVTKTPLGAALRSLSELEFIETPVQDVVDYLKDYHGIEIAVMQRRDDKFANTPLTFPKQEIPACLALSLVAAQAGGDWDVLDNVVIIGPTGRIEELRGRRLERLRRDVRLGRTEGNRAVTTQPTALEFIETPIQDVVDYLSDYHEANFALARGCKPDTPITFCLRGVALGTVLDLTLFYHNLHWDSDDEVVYLGDAKAIEGFRAMVAGRATRRERYPEELAETLQHRIQQLNFDKAALAEVAAWLDKNAGMGVRLGQVPDAVKNDKINLYLKNIPLDALLDLLCLDRGLQWRVTEWQTVVIEAK